MINMDMVGRLAGRTLVVGGTGTAAGLSDLTRGFCDELALHMIDDPPGTAPSDNSSFYDAGVPCLFLFTGLHGDYHRATDDSQKLDLVGARDIGRLAERLLRALDGRDARPEFRPAPGSAMMFTPHLYLGCALEEAVPPGPEGARVAVLIPDTPAASAGLREGDTIAEWAGHPVGSVSELEALLVPPTGEVRPVALAVWRAAQPGAVRERGETSVRARAWERVELEVLPVIR